MIPARLRRNAVDVWGTAGAAWLDRLPELLDTIAADWDLDIEEPFVLSYHWVAATTRADVPGCRLRLRQGRAVGGVDGGTPGSRALDVARLLQPRVS